MRKLEWSPDALEDLDVIWSYIAEDNVERASSFVEELQAQARKLVDDPWTGVIIPELNEEEYREKYYKGYTIVYEVRSDAVRVHEVYNQTFIQSKSIKKKFIRERL